MIELTAPCPHCGRAYDLSYRMRGDRVWCLGCGKWFLVSFLLNGDPFLVKVEPPIDVRSAENKNPAG